MNRIKLHPIGVLVLSIVLLMPFSYLELGGVRVIFLSGLAAMLVVFVSVKGKLFFDLNLILFLPSFLMVVLYSMFSESAVIFAAVLFFLHLIVFNFVGASQLEGLLKKSLFAYQLGALFMALGVLAQRIMFEFWGVELGKIDFYGGERVGFGFIWLDYSFLSLYLVTAIPLALYSWNSKSIMFLVSLVLLAGAVVTTARTGLAALVFAILLFAGVEIMKSFKAGRVSKRMLFSIVFFSAVSSIFIYYFSVLSTRKASLSGSGRIEGYYSALRSFSESPVVGVMFDDKYYFDNYGIIPHNLFFYILSQGGAIFFVLFFAWFFYVFRLAFFKLRVLGFSVVTGAFGFMFVPSFFSAYFYALLISFAMAEYRLRKQGVWM